MSNQLIPPKSREEWQKMINGEIQHKYRNFALQMKLTQIRREVSENKMTMDEAVDSIYQLCAKYAAAVKGDFKQIFISW